MKDKIIEKYSELVSKRPFTLLIIIAVSTLLLASGASKVETVEQNNEDLLPDTISSVNAFDVIGAEFGQDAGGSTYTVLLETEPEYANSSEIRDVRDPEFLRYLDTVSTDLESHEDIVTVNSAADLVSSPSDLREASEQLSNSRASSYISEDYSFTIIRITAVDVSDQEQLAEFIQQSVETIEGPTGVEASYTGSPFIDQAFQDQADSTMGLTSMISLVGIVVVIVLLFSSVTYGLISLLALIFGILSGYGMYGLLGLDMSPATSGAVSMGMGIAIDFGIQTVSRYREEREIYGIESAVQETVQGVLNPMTIALIAALIGFTSLSFGRITFLSDLGTMLTLTTLFAFIGALTLIPVMLVLNDRYRGLSKEKGKTGN